MTPRRSALSKALLLGLAMVLITDATAQEMKKPNIMVIWGDDIGQFNISAYNLGMMGYRNRMNGKTDPGIYADGMVQHDRQISAMLAELKKLGLDENTIVTCSTNNGAKTFSSPDGNSIMFRGEKNTQWEGGYRVPCMIKWPGVIKPGTIVNDVGAHEDMLMIFVTAAGDRTVKEDLLKGRSR